MSRRLWTACLVLALAGCRATTADPAAGVDVALTLDRLHRAAAEADEQAYFELFAPDAVFLGTDPSERWTRAEFRAWARPYFSAGRGWTYEAVERNVRLSEAGDVAWFDERLRNTSYGECRGTGVAVRIDGRWRIAQYSLSLPVPNELASDLVERIRQLPPE
jgi:ketosteroid isomerase-like protein